MKNTERQKSLVKQYGKEGGSFYCEYCDFVKDKKIIQEMKDITGNNCSFNFDPGDCPCAKAYNRSVREKKNGY